MTSRIGLAVARDQVRAVAVRRAAIYWAGEMQRAPLEPLPTTIANLLRQAPRGRFERTKVVAAIGPAHVQTKRLIGLPPTKDSRVASQLIQEGVGRFFLVNGIRVLTSDICAVNGEPWAAAFEQPVVEAVEDGCRVAGLSLDGIVPSVAVLGRALGGEAFEWWDGDVGIAVSMAQRELISVRRLGSSPPEERGTSIPHPVAALGQLGDDGGRFADAYGAALGPSPTRLALRRGQGRPNPLPAWRLVLAATATTIALGAAILAPPVQAKAQRRSAERQLAAIDAHRVVVATLQANLRQVSGALEEASRFTSQRSSATLFLSQLTTALPDGSAIVALRFAGPEGNLVALTPRAATVVDRLDAIPGVVSPEIIGPVTREAVAGREVERVTIRFRLETASLRDRGSKP